MVSLIFVTLVLSQSNGTRCADPLGSEKNLRDRIVFVSPEVEDCEKVVGWLSVLDLFAELHPSFAYSMSGMLMEGRRPQPESFRIYSIECLVAENHSKRARRCCMTSRDVTPEGDRSVPRFSQPAFSGDLTQKSIVIKYADTDLLTLDKRSWVYRSEENEVTPEGLEAVESNLKAQGMLDPINDIFFVPPVTVSYNRPLIEQFDQTRIQGIAKEKDITFVRWLYPIERKMVYSTVIGFRNELPVIIYDEIGMGIAEKFKPLWSQGYNEVEWKQYSHENVLPVKIRKMICTKPEEKKRNTIDREWNLELSWFLDDEVPPVFFERESLGNLELGKYLPK